MGIVLVQGEASRRLCVHVCTRAMVFAQKGNWNFHSAELVGTTERGGRPFGRRCGKLKWWGGSGSELGLSRWEAVGILCSLWCGEKFPVAAARGNWEKK